jgi:hypothetical protein
MHCHQERGPPEKRIGEHCLSSWCVVAVDVNVVLEESVPPWKELQAIKPDDDP